MSIQFIGRSGAVYNLELYPHNIIPKDIRGAICIFTKSEPSPIGNLYYKLHIVSTDNAQDEIMKERQWSNHKICNSVCIRQEENAFAREVIFQDLASNPDLLGRSQHP